MPAKKPVAKKPAVKKAAPKKVVTKKLLLIRSQLLRKNKFLLNLTTVATHAPLACHLTFLVSKKVSQKLTGTRKTLLAPEPAYASANISSALMLFKNIRRMQLARLCHRLTEPIGLLQPEKDQGLKYF